MRKGLFKLSICILLLGFFLIAHIERQNELTRLRLQIPQINAKTKVLRESALQMKSRVQKKETPRQLLALLKQPQFQHLHFPQTSRVWIIEKDCSNQRDDTLIK